MTFVKYILLLNTFLGFVFYSDMASAELACHPGEKIEIAAEDAFFPYSGLYKGQHRGYAFDIVRAAYAAVNCELVLKSATYNRCMYEVETSRLLGCFNTTNSNENQRKYILHTKPLFYGKILVYARADDPNTFDRNAYHKSRFAVVAGYTYSDEFDRDPAVNKVEVESDLQTLAMVAAGRADYALVYEKVAMYQMAGNKSFIKQVPVPVDLHATYGLYVSFSRGMGEKAQRAADLLDRGLSIITINGTYQTIEETWDEWLENGQTAGEPAPLWQLNG